MLMGAQSDGATRKGRETFSAFPFLFRSIDLFIFAERVATVCSRCFRWGLVRSFGQTLGNRKAGRRAGMMNGGSPNKNSPTKIFWSEKVWHREMTVGRSHRTTKTATSLQLPFVPSSTHDSFLLTHRWSSLRVWYRTSIDGAKYATEKRESSSG